MVGTRSHLLTIEPMNVQLLILLLVSTMHYDLDGRRLGRHFAWAFLLVVSSGGCTDPGPPPLDASHRGECLRGILPLVRAELGLDPDVTEHQNTVDVAQPFRGIMEECRAVGSRLTEARATDLTRPVEKSDHFRGVIQDRQGHFYILTRRSRNQRVRGRCSSRMS
jgi:hypothetical protein